MRNVNFKLLGLALLLTAASSCAINMKMQGNRFESSEVYGKTAFRIKTAYTGQSNTELTPDDTLYPPTTSNPDVGPNHTVIIGAGLGIKDRVEIGVDTNWVGKAKFQLLGDPKIRATEGNFSLAVVGSLGFFSYDKSDTGLFSSQEYKVHFENTNYGGQLVAGYRVDRLVNLYAGPFVERGDYTGTYETVGVSKTDFKGSALNRGGVIGIEIGSPRCTGIIEAAWNHTTSGQSKNSFWVGGAQILISFGSTKEHGDEVEYHSETRTSRHRESESTDGDVSQRKGF
jgi:hypothetical protein